MDELPQILTPEAVAKLLHCSPKTVEDRLRSGDLPGHKFGEGWVLPTRALIERVNEIAVEQMLARRQAVSRAVSNATTERPAVTQRPPPLHPATRT